MDAHEAVRIKRLTLYSLEPVLVMKTGNTQDNT